MKIRGQIDWECRIVYESGVLKASDADLALAGGFDGILVGEGVVRNPELIGELLERQKNEGSAGTEHSSMPDSPWKALGARWKPGRPLVKICGLTNKEDFDLAVAEGADLCGFILAPSPRQTNTDFIRSLPESPALKVGVVVLEENEELPGDIGELLDEGFLDLIQYHGKESPLQVAAGSLAPGRKGHGYKALRVKSVEDLDRIADYYPRPCLLDAFVKGQARRYGQTDRGFTG